MNMHYRASSSGARLKGTCRPAGCCWDHALVCDKHGTPPELARRDHKWRGSHSAFAGLALLILFHSMAFAQDSKVTSPLEGTWKWSFTMPDGTQVTPRLELKQADGQLTGTTRF